MSEPITVDDHPAPTGGHGRLTLYILLAIVAALVFAWFAPRYAAMTAIGGEIFLNLLSMLVVPLVVTSVMSGVLGMGDVRKLGKPGGWTLIYFLGTTVLAVIIGLATVNIIQPGKHTNRPVGQEDVLSGKQKDRRNQEQIRDAIAEIADVSPDSVAKTFPKLPTTGQPSSKDAIENLIRLLFTRNLVTSATAGDLLPLIAFSILFAAVLTTLGTRSAELSRLIVQANDALMAVVLLIMYVAPIGIFCLVASRFGEAAAEGPEKLKELANQTGWYMATVILGLTIHAVGVLPLIFWLVRRQNPFRFIVQMGESLLTAFSTSSSTATLPVTIESAVTKAKISRRAADFVIPLGATVNMNGTALYEAAAALFIAQVMNIELGFTAQVTVALTSTLAAIGAAGIPEAGLVTMLIVLSAVGLPTEAIGLILSVDWLLDRFRTAVNVFGDAVGAAVIEKTLPAD